MIFSNGTKQHRIIQSSCVTQQNAEKPVFLHFEEKAIMSNITAAGDYHISNVLDRKL